MRTDLSRRALLVTMASAGVTPAFARTPEAYREGSASGRAISALAIVPGGERLVTGGTMRAA